MASFDEASRFLKTKDVETNLDFARCLSLDSQVFRDGGLSEMMGSNEVVGSNGILGFEGRHLDVTLDSTLS